MSGDSGLQPGQAGGIAGFLGSLVGFILQVEGNKAQDALDELALRDNLAQVEKARQYAKRQEVDALAQGGVEAGRLRMQGSALEGKQRISYAMGGIDASSGTAAQTIASSRIMSELEAETARNNARRQALGHQKVQEDLAFKGKTLQRDATERKVQRQLQAAGGAAGLFSSALSVVSMGMKGT